jgi:hypothetical protein
MYLELSKRLTVWNGGISHFHFLIFYYILASSRYALFFLCGTMNKGNESLLQHHTSNELCYFFY